MKQSACLLLLLFTFVYSCNTRSHAPATSGDSKGCKLRRIETGYDCSMLKDNISTIEGPNQMFDCRLDEEDSTLSPFQRYVDSFTSKRVNWEIASQEQHLWTITSQEKCYFQQRDWGSKIVKVRHIGSAVHSILPATWEEKYSRVKPFGLGIEVRCGGILTIYIPGLPGQSFSKRYELVKSIKIFKGNIERT